MWYQNIISIEEIVNIETVKELVGMMDGKKVIGGFGGSELVYRYLRQLHDVVDRFSLCSVLIYVLFCLASYLVSLSLQEVVLFVPRFCANKYFLFCYYYYYYYYYYNYAKDDKFGVLTLRVIFECDF